MTLNTSKSRGEREVTATCSKLKMNSLNRTQINLGHRGKDLSNYNKYKAWNLLICDLPSPYFHQAVSSVKSLQYLVKKVITRSPAPVEDLCLQASHHPIVNSKIESLFNAFLQIIYKNNNRVII